MGIYNSQYENYYAKLRKNTYGQSSNYANRNKKPKKQKGLFTITPASVVKTIIFQLVAVFILMTVVTVSKANIIPQSDIVYNWFKNSIDKNIEYQAVMARVSNIKLSDFEDKFQEIFEKVRQGLTGEETTKAFIENNFKFAIDTEKNMLSAYDGVVKTIGLDSTGSKYVVINHGKGIETKYTNLEEVYVSKDEPISKGMSIGSYASEIDYQEQIELLYMGRNINYMGYVSE